MHTAPSASQPSVVVEVRDLTYRYGDREALRGVSFSVSAGEIFGVLGPNGGGKSTLFRILSTMVAPGEGSLSLFGKDPARELNGVRRELGVVFQSPSLDLMLTARENLMHQGHLYGLRGRALSERMAAMLEAVGLAERAAERVDRFSGGMRRRLEIAKALLHEPRLLILDEPSTGLDPGARRDLWTHLHRLRDVSGVTVLLTTHLMDEAEHCDRLLILDRGLKVALDTPVALKERVGGDVVTVDVDDPEALATKAAARFGVSASVVGGRVRVERERGHELAAALVEAFPGRIRAVSIGKPTLEDVFIDLTGRRFEEADAEGAAVAPSRARRRRGRRGGPGRPAVEPQA